MKKRYIFLIVICLLILVGLILSRSTADPNRQITWGITFEETFAKKLGLDWQAAYLAMLDDLGVKKIRLVAHWLEVEPKEGQFDFTELDWQVAQAQERDVKIILAVGYRLPRWPECHQPEWVIDQRPALLGYMEKVVNRYKDNAAVFAWEVENEPFLSFGECPKLDVKLLDEEIALVRQLDSRPIILTDSGELSWWVRAAKRADIFGTTMYRWVWNQQLGSYKYPIPPGFFRLKERLVRLFVGWQKPFVVIELQGEPWTHKQIYEIPIEEQLKLMPLTEFISTIDYAKQTGFSEYYWWGAEWWYYLKQNGHPEYWDKVKELISANK
ncbi:MAG TPA: hypothetical protein DHI91_01800 [Candidatus Portnoybacteria bacterium]|nr:hypothetical protein [Candidatus Portnoybacteria bacterium]